MYKNNEGILSRYILQYQFKISLKSLDIINVLHLCSCIDYFDARSFVELLSMKLQVILCNKSNISTFSDKNIEFA